MLKFSDIVNRTRQFVVSKTGLAIVLFVIANTAAFAMFHAARGPAANALQSDLSSDGNQSPMCGTWTWWIANAYFENPKPPDVVLLGSSLVNSAVWSADAIVLQRAVDCVLHHRVYSLEKDLQKRIGVAPQTVNCAIGGCMASDFYVLSHALFSQTRKPKMVIIGVAPRDFIDNRLKSASSTEPFKYLSQYLENDHMRHLAFNNTFERLNTESEWLFERLPLRRFHSYVKQSTQSDVPAAGAQGNQLLAAISNTAMMIKPGIVIVPPVVLDGFEDNSAEYIKRYRNPFSQRYSTQMSFFNELLSWLHETDIKVLVVSMPTLPENRALLPDAFWQDYRNRLKVACSSNAATFVDLSDNPAFAKKDYVDTVHLNWRGGVKVVDMISDAVADAPALVDVLKDASGQKTAARASATTH